MLSMLGRRKTIQNNLGRLTMSRAKLAMERLSRFSFFSQSDYADLNPDIGGMPATMHYIGYGADEQRPSVKAVRLARQLGLRSANLEGPTVSASSSTALPAHGMQIGIYVSTLGNVFMRQIASGLGELLNSAGYAVTYGNENSPIESRPKYTIYVAPHEFFLLGAGRDWVRDDVLSEACMYCTEQVQTPWFWKSLHIVLMAKSVIDISLPMATAFSEVMPAARVFPAARVGAQVVKGDVLAHPLLSGQQWWAHQAAPFERPLDLCFFGNSSPHRADFFARNATRLSQHEGFVYLRTRKAGEVMNGEDSERALVDVAQFVARHSKILLNIHRDEFSYFEWHRVVNQGMANGCVVVSEPCFADPAFLPGVHYLSDETNKLPDLIDWILRDKDGMVRAQQVAEAARAAASDASLARKGAATVISMLMVDS